MKSNNKNKIIKGIMLFVSLLIVGVIGSIVSCGSLVTTGIDTNAFPPPMSVDITAASFTEQAIEFTGDPEVDFGASYLITNDAGDFSPTSADIEKVYVAFSKKYLFIGHKTTDQGTGDFFDRGAFYTFIDNGVTNSTDYPESAQGITRIDSQGLSEQGISGSFRFLDDVGLRTTSPRKFSAFSKHYRTPFYAKGPDCVLYTFMKSALTFELVQGSSSTLSGAYYLDDNVTELAIPWSFIYPDLATNAMPGLIYLAFSINDAAASKYFSGADWAPNGAVDESQANDVITNWIAIRLTATN